MNNPFTRKSSSYTLRVEIPGANGEVLAKLLDAALVEALGTGTVTGSWFRRLAPELGIDIPFVAVSFRATDDAQAAIYGQRILRALGKYNADLHTGYGTHKRWVATTRDEELANEIALHGSAEPLPGDHRFDVQPEPAPSVEEIEKLLGGDPWNPAGETK